MIIAELPFKEFDTLLKTWAKKKHFELIIYLVSRNADNPKLFQEIDNSWSALHDVTGQKMLFVIIDGQSNTFQNDRRQIEGSYGFYLYSPFCKMTTSLETELSYDGYFSKYIVPHHQIENSRKWEQNHSVSMSEVAKVLNLSEKEIPCINFYLVSSEQSLTFSLKNISSDFSIYRILKRISENEVFFNRNLKKSRSAEFFNSKKYKKFRNHQQTISILKSGISSNSSTDEWIKSVLNLQPLDKDVYKNISHLTKELSNKDFSNLRAALNSLVYISDDTTFIENLKFEQMNNNQAERTPKEFELFIEECFTHNYQLD